MCDMEKRVLNAKSSKREMEQFILDYLPFIKKQASGTEFGEMEPDDRVSVATLAFVNSIYQYIPERGAFLLFAKVCIRNRLLDELRSHRRYAAGIWQPKPEDKGTELLEQRVSEEFYNREEERKCLEDEIREYSLELEKYGINFRELVRTCPKQERSRAQCVRLAKHVFNCESYREKLLIHNRLEQAGLSREFGISPKTIEKHRKYIVSLVLLYAGDYPGIQAFLPDK